MKQDSSFTVKKFTSVSSRIFLLCVLFFCLAGTIAAALEFLEAKWKWLEIIGTVLLVISELLLAISWVTPGILITLRVPWLAHAWLRGINPIAISNTPWEQLSGIQKFFVYFWAILLSGFTLFAIVGLIIHSIRG